MTMPWPSPTDPIVGITYSLYLRDDLEGNPIYGQGVVHDERERAAVQRLLAPLEPHPAQLAAVTMGEVSVELASGRRLTLRPLFDRSEEGYADLLKVEQFDCPMPGRLAELLNTWRAGLLDRPPPAAA